MDILNNLEWYFYYDEPSEAKVRDKGTKITRSQLDVVVFNDSVKENVKFCFPLNDDFSYTETRELAHPVTVEDILQLVHSFYNEPLTQETIDDSFGDNSAGKLDWEEEMKDRHGDGDTYILSKYNLFDDNSGIPDFCGIHLIESPSENQGEYFIQIGPE
jgi:hypothetical protein